VEAVSHLGTLTPALHNTLLRHTRTDIRSCITLFLTFTWGRKLDMGRASSSSPFSPFPFSGSPEISWTADLETLGLFPSCGEEPSSGKAMVGVFVKPPHCRVPSLCTVGLQRPSCEIPTVYLLQYSHDTHCGFPLAGLPVYHRYTGSQAPFQLSLSQPISLEEGRSRSRRKPPLVSSQKGAP
jgi:hypothetical protein